MQVESLSNAKEQLQVQAQLVASAAGCKCRRTSLSFLTSQHSGLVSGMTWFSLMYLEVETDVLELLDVQCLLLLTLVYMLLQLLQLGGLRTSNIQRCQT